MKCVVEDRGGLMVVMGSEAGKPGFGRNLVVEVGDVWVDIGDMK
jgi:hypothetical protein